VAGPGAGTARSLYGDSLMSRHTQALMKEHRDQGISFIRNIFTMEKIKNGDAVLYKNLKGTIYGKPRENKYKGLLYTVKIGDEYVKATAHELTLNAEEVPANGYQLFAQAERR
jgi:hypothetical protein